MRPLSVHVRQHSVAEQIEDDGAVAGLDCACMPREVLTKSICPHMQEHQFTPFSTAQLGTRTVVEGGVGEAANAGEGKAGVCEAVEDSSHVCEGR